jgi:hypothetical protein
MVEAPITLLPGSIGAESELKKVIAPACTLKLVPKHSPPESTPAAENSIPKGSHWVDLTEPGTVVVIDQPEGQKCAAVGGMMAQRMKLRGVAGCVIGGRFRDLAELRESQLPVCILVFLVMCDVVPSILSSDLLWPFLLRRPLTCLDLCSGEINRWDECRGGALRSQCSCICDWCQRVACEFCSQPVEFTQFRLTFSRATSSSVILLKAL